MKNNTKITLKIYWQHARQYKISIMLSVLGVVGAAALNVAVPLYYKKFFDTLANAQIKEAAIPILIGILIYILILKLIEWACWRVVTFGVTYFETGVIADLSNTCFQYLHKHSFFYFNNNFIGSLVKRVNRFTRAFESIGDKIVWNLLPLTVNIGLVLIVLIYKNTILGLILLGWLILFFIINWIFTNYKLKYDIERSLAETEVSKVLADTITNHNNVRLFVGYAREMANFFLVTKKMRELMAFAWNLSNVFEAVQGFLMVLLEIGLFYWGLKLWQKNLFTIGDFVLLQSYVLLVVIKIWDFGRTIRHAYQDLADAEEMTEILTTPHEITDRPGAKDLVVSRGQIEFKDVNFNYKQKRTILADFSLVIKPREKLAFAGPSGAGKTTIAGLLLRLFDTDSGSILIDGQDITAVTQESLRKNISLVPQDPILFHRSLMENIRYGKPEATNEQVLEAAKLAHCDEFIRQLSAGYDTFVGERGVKLSGGERQRVAIARAILRDAPILILDEATSSLDSESEGLIQDALARLMKDKTVIVIAHRLSTIMKMDRIVVIENGRIIEEGTHDELLAHVDGIYKKLWELQAGGFIK
ncbi:MAG: ABC transporter ATP-binding protein [Patescibacteria group bacterium]